MEQSLNYNIISFDKDKHKITVIFTRFDISKEIDIPIVDDKYITGLDLQNYITSFCPIIEEKNIPILVKNSDEIEKLVNPIHSKNWNNKKEKDALLSMRHHMLLSSDWTQLPDAQEQLDDEDKKLWKEYRQALRDITKQPGWPLNVDWPKRPHILGVIIFE